MDTNTSSDLRPVQERKPWSTPRVIVGELSRAELSTKMVTCDGSSTMGPSTIS